MECLEAKALKSSFHWELAMKSPSQPEASEEIWCANVISGEDFKVEEFLNFPNGDLEHGSSSLQIEEEEGKDGFFSNKTGDSLFNDDSDSYLSVGLSIPNDALADLEWVSQFVDDSCLDFSFSCPAVKSDTFRSQPETRTEISCFPLAFPVRPRSKRSRQSKPAKSSSNQSPSSSSSSASSGISSTPCFIFTDPGENEDSFNGPNEPPKKQRKTTAHQGGSVSTVQFQRRCSHCLVQKTPQWRTGPNGAKTLCNACGVRYKSGRLFPEYRPALSPTFCSDIHSNSHRKVLEIRKVKEIGEPVSGLTQMVQSY